MSLRGSFEIWKPQHGEVHREGFCVHAITFDDAQAAQGAQGSPEGVGKSIIRHGVNSACRMDGEDSQYVRSPIGAFEGDDVADLKLRRRVVFYALLNFRDYGLPSLHKSSWQNNSIYRMSVRLRSHVGASLC